MRVLWFGLAGTCAEKRSVTVIGQCGHAENDGAIGFAIGARFASRKKPAVCESRTAVNEPISAIQDFLATLKLRWVFAGHPMAWE